MKKLLFLLLLLPLSCEKPKDQQKEIICWECRWELTIKSIDYYTSTCRDTCMSEEDKILYEQYNTWVRAGKENKMTCWRQGEPPL